VYQFIIRNLPASSLPNVFQRNERVISSNLDTRRPLVSTTHGLKTMAYQSNESYCSVIAEILQIVTQIRHTLVPLSNRGGVPTFTVDRTLYCKVWITNSQNQSQIHSLILLHIPSASEPLAYSVGYFFTLSFVHWLTQKPLSITQTFSWSLMYTQLILFTNSIKIKLLDLIHSVSQWCHRSHTLTVSYTQLFTHKLTSSEAYQFVCSLTHQFTDFLGLSHSHLLSHSISRRFVHGRLQLVTHSSIHSFIHSDY
jgi:hypothetical protein